MGGVADDRADRAVGIEVAELLQPKVSAGGITWATRWSCSGPVPMWKSAPSGAGDLLGEELAHGRAAGDAPDHLADEVALGEARGSPDAVPGSHIGACAASSEVAFSQS